MKLSSEYYTPCPYCGSENAVAIDYSYPGKQEFVIDCEICCRPINVRIKISGNDIVYFEAQRESG